MRVAFPLLALTLATGAAAQQTGASAFDRAPLIVVQGHGHGPPFLDRSPPRLEPPRSPHDERVCRDRIQQIRDERGLPKLDRDNASSDEPLLIAAVDQRIGGCSVMVMRNDTSDIRPLPTGEGSARLQRLPGQ
jgi:hypothetical protein